MRDRKAAWFDFEHSPAREELESVCGRGTGDGRVSIQPYFPGRTVSIKHHPDQKPVKLSFPANREKAVPKGFVARLHLLVMQESFGRDSDLHSVIFGCIDGSGAFKYESLKLLVEPFKNDPSVDIVFGRRPADDTGMPPGRKEMEEFEQYLLFRHRWDGLRRTFDGYNLDQRLLPDGQAGCWAFRLSASHKLPLTASSYEIEFDLLACAVDAGLKGAYTKPLLMADRPRYSAASTDPYGTSIRKFPFIQRKLSITRDDIWEAWNDFRIRFAGSPLLTSLQSGYEIALREYCSAER